MLWTSIDGTKILEILEIGRLSGNGRLSLWSACTPLSRQSRALDPCYRPAQWHSSSPLASSMLAPGLPEIADKYHMTNSTLIALTLTYVIGSYSVPYRPDHRTSVFLLAYAVGPLLLSPLSEIYGRQWVLHISNLFFLAFNLGCAFATSGSMLIGFRFLGAFHRLPYSRLL